MADGQKVAVKAADGVPESPIRPSQRAQDSTVPQQPSQGQGAWRKHHTVFTNAKAGMDGVDRDHVQRIVYEMSKDSAHFKNEQRKQAQTDEKIARLRERAARLSPAELAGHLRAADHAVEQLAATRDLTATWLVVDMDAFFASVEELHNPSLKDKPMAVGGIGMISTANYVARKFGVRSAMPGFIARKLCPQLVFQRPDFSRYKAVSEQAQAIFAAFDDDLEASSLDEAFLDITAYCAQHNCTGSEAAEQLRRRVLEESGVTCSCGVAPNRMLAKVCADRNKPDGQFVLPGQIEAVNRFMRDLPIRKVPGIGKVMEQTLKAFEVEFCSQLIDRRALLSALFSKVSVQYFMTVGLGLGATRHGERPVEGEVGRKGISCERTFSALSAPADLEAKLREISEKLAEHMAREGLQGRTVTLKLKSALTFELHTRAATLPGYVSGAEQLMEVALQLLRPELPITVRLMGIRVSAFKEQPAPEPGQKTLADFVRRLPQHAGHGCSADEAQQEAQQDAFRGGHPEGSSVARDRDNELGVLSPDHMRHMDRLPSLLAQQDGSRSADGGFTGSGDVVVAADLRDERRPLELSLHGWASDTGCTDEDMDGGTDEDAEGLVAASGHHAAHCGSRPGGAVSGGPPLQTGELSQPQELSLRDWQSDQSRTPAPTPGFSAGGCRERKQWECRTCTYLNLPHLLRCELCDVPRLGPLSAHAAGAGHRASQEQQTARIARHFGEIPVSSAAAGNVPLAKPLPGGEDVVNRTLSASVVACSDAAATAAAAAATAAAAAAPAGALTAEAAVSDRQGGLDSTPEQQPWHCRECSAALPQAQRQEHIDWHFAARLQQQANRSASPAQHPYSAACSAEGSKGQSPGVNSGDATPASPPRGTRQGRGGGPSLRRHGHMKGREGRGGRDGSTPRQHGQSKGGGGRGLKRQAPAAGTTIDVLLSRHSRAREQTQLPD